MSRLSDDDVAGLLAYLRMRSSSRTVRDGPSSFPELYERWLVGPLFRPWAELVVDRARLAAGERVLDVACGTGIVARLVMQHLSGGGDVVGVDVSPQMLAVARAIEPRVDWRTGEASALPLDDGERFDVVLCHQGLQFFPDKPAAAREMRRAMGRGGRLVLGVWTSLAETPFFNDLHHMAERRLGPFVDVRHSCGDPPALERLFSGAGFERVRVERLTRAIRVAEPAMFVRLNIHGLVGMNARSSTMADDERARLCDLIAEDSAEVVRHYMGADGLVFELGACVVTAYAK